MYSERMPARGTLTLYQDGESVKYTISSVKGCGGTSVIYEAERSNGMRCIIKELAPGFPGGIHVPPREPAAEIPRQRAEQPGIHERRRGFRAVLRYDEPARFQRSHGGGEYRRVYDVRRIRRAVHRHGVESAESGRLRHCGADVPGGDNTDVPVPCAHAEGIPRDGRDPSGYQAFQHTLVGKVPLRQADRSWLRGEH